ncbi:MAG: CHASE3 domain-containing protein [Bacteroidales bacterium]|nr:CHASE3 domain-containing protein [Bacteroidales bacterium]
MIPTKSHTNNKILYAIGFFSAFAGILVLLGWYINDFELRSFGLGHIEMKPAYAIFFILAGLNILFLQKYRQKKYRLLAKMFSSAILLLCSMVLFKYFFKTEMDLANLLGFELSNDFNTIFKNKISFNSIFSAVLIGISLTILSFNWAKNKLLVLFFAILILSISFIGFINYIFDLAEIAGLPVDTKMSANTSVLNFLLGIALLFMLNTRRNVRQSFENILLFGITLASVLIIFGSIVSISSIKTLVSASKGAEKSHEVKLELRKVLLVIYELTSEKYGYLLSEDDRFLNDQSNKKARINTILSAIDELVNDNPKQKEHMLRLREMTKEYIAYSEHIIDVKKADKNEFAKELVVNLQKKQVLNEMSSLIAQMLDEEDRNLIERKNSADENVYHILLIIVISFSLQLIILGFIFVLVRRDIAARIKARKELMRTNFHLDKMVKERTQELEITISELEISRDKAEASDRLKTAFLNNISHEIRTPLNGILGFAPFIVQPDCSYEEKEEYLEILNKSSERLVNTITDYTDISMLVSGTMETHFEELEISSLITEIYDQFKQPCQDKNLKLKILLPEDESDYKIKTDRNLLGKLLRHLLDNALKFTHSGAILISANFIGDRLEIYVKDSGQGIAKNEQKRVFEFFMQEYIDNTRGYEGSGLGLSIVKGITHLLGGKLRLDSVKNEGTTVYIFLPLDID